MRSSLLLALFPLLAACPLHRPPCTPVPSSYAAVFHGPRPDVDHLVREWVASFPPGVCRLATRDDQTLPDGVTVVTRARVACLGCPGEVGGPPP